jgi:hypothetical protein
MGCIDSTTQHFKVYCPELGYIQRYSRIIVDENIKGGKMVEYGVLDSIIILFLLS